VDTSGCSRSPQALAGLVEDGAAHGARFAGSGPQCRGGRRVQFLPGQDLGRWATAPWSPRTPRWPTISVAGRSRRSRRTSRFHHDCRPQQPVGLGAGRRPRAQAARLDGQQGRVRAWEHTSPSSPSGPAGHPTRGGGRVPRGRRPGGQPRQVCAGLTEAGSAGVCTTRCPATWRGLRRLRRACRSPSGPPTGSSPCPCRPP